MAAACTAPAASIVPATSTVRLMFKLPVAFSPVTSTQPASARLQTGAAQRTADAPANGRGAPLLRLRRLDYRHGLHRRFGR